jgi:Trypsin
MVRVHRHWLEIAFALLAFVQSVSARARDKPVPVTFGKDDRRIADTKGSPWDAVGRVNSSITANSNSYSYNFCSGTLIAPDVVATMAPCVAYLRNKPEKLHFVTGDLRGEYQETVSVKCVFLSKAGGFDDGLFDVALLVLARKLRATPLALSAETEFVPGTPVSHAGYGGDRARASRGTDPRPQSRCLAGCRFDGLGRRTTRLRRPARLLLAEAFEACLLRMTDLRHPPHHRNKAIAARNLLSQDRVRPCGRP